MLQIPFPGRASRPSADLRVRRGAGTLPSFLLLLLLAPAPGLSGQVGPGRAPVCYGGLTPAGTSIENSARVSALLPGGRTLSLRSPVSRVLVEQVAGLELEAPQSARSRPGGTVHFPHVLRNLGNGPDEVALAVEAPEGWRVQVHLDLDGDGLLQPGEPVVDGLVPIDCADVHLVVVVAVPERAQPDGPASVTLTVTSGADPTRGDDVIDQIVLDGRLGLSVQKQVDLAEATPGEVLGYTLTLAATGEDARERVLLSDTLPEGLEYVASSLSLDGVVLTDADDGDRGTVRGGRVVEVDLGELEGGRGAVVTFRARVSPALPAGERVENVAVARGAGGTTVRSAPAVTWISDLVVEKTVARESVGAGDLLAWSIGVRGRRAPGGGVTVVDTLPALLAYVPGTLTVDGASRTDAADEDGAGVEGRVVEVRLTGPDTGAVRVGFQTRVAADAEPGAAIVNVARAAAGRVVRADTAITRVAGPALTFEKVRVGTGAARPGDTVSFRIRLANGSAGATARGVVVVDSLPEGLTPLVATPAGVVEGQAVRWALDELPPGAEVVWTLEARIESGVAPSVLANVASFAAEGGASGRDTAEVSVAGGASLPALLTLDLSSEVLEASVGDRIPLLVRVTNVGAVTLSDLATRISLPRGTRFTGHRVEGRREAATGGATAGTGAGGAASGPFVADSTLVRNDSLVVWVPGTLAPGEAYLFPYELAVMAAPSRQLRHGAVAVARRGSVLAEADDDVVASNDDATLVRIERNRPLESRTVLGKVWADLDGDRVQDPDEPGLPDVDVWTESGDVATTDQEGKLSFVGLLPGRHVYRLDPATLPAAFRPRWDEVDDVQSTRTDGWTSGHVAFPVLPRSARSVALAATDATAMAATGCARLTAGHAGALGPAPECSTRAGRATAAGSGGPSGPDGGAGDGGAGGSRPERTTPAGAVEVTLEPRPEGWPEVALRLPEGWSVEPGSSTNRGLALPDPRTVRDRDGRSWAVWTGSPGAPSPVHALLLTTPPAHRVDRPALTPLRSAEERDADAGLHLVRGPGVRIFAPADGHVASSDRVFVGVEGEALRPAALFDGDSLLAEVTLRPDGVHDFIGLQLAAGPHVLRVRTLNTWGQERWDSARVHVSGRPARLVEADVRSGPLTLGADGTDSDVVRLRVLDRWGVPSITGQALTVEAEGVRIVAPDADPASVGQQLRADEGGWVAVPVTAGREAGRGRIVLTVPGDEAVRLELPMLLLAPAGDLMITGVGEVSLGAAPEGFAAVTARGRIDERTGLTVSWDSRRGDVEDEAFGRVVDPLDEGSYPLLGDASSRRSPVASRYALSARLERDLDWLAVGDVRTAGFGAGGRLGRYERSLPGAATHLERRGVQMDVFGALTRQGLRTVQIRGDGTSGPYALGPGILPGTDRVALEVRAAENATRTLTRRVLERFVDYQLDEESGTLLLKQAVPAADARGNPVFLLATYETATGAEASPVWGVRARTDLAGGAALAGVDSLPVGLTVVSDRQSGGFHLLGADLGLESRGGASLKGEVAWAEAGDSSGLALSLEGRTRVGGLVELEAGWLHMGDGFVNPSDPALRAGTDELRLGASLAHQGTEVGLRYERQAFASHGLLRDQAALTVQRDLGPDLALSTRLNGSRAEGSGEIRGDASGATRLTWKPTSRLSLWGEAHRSLWEADRGAPRGDHVEAGAALRVHPGVELELSHRQVLLPDSGSYALTSAGVKSTLGEGANAWGRYQLAAGVDGATNAAVVGLNHRVRLGRSWALDGLLERRKGVERAPGADAVRALPFADVEEDYWSVGLGAELLPQDRPYRLTVRGEAKEGSLERSRLVTAAGDVTLNRSWAILSRQELLERQPRAGSESRLRSLWALAYRPARSESLNLLLKVDWLDEERTAGHSVVSEAFDRERTLVVGEAIWRGGARFTVALRQALRHSSESLPEVAGMRPVVRSRASFTGARADLELTSWLGARAELRRLADTGTRDTAWDAAPALVLRPVGAFEVIAGYRWGELQDPDFAARSGTGAFLTLGVRVTERGLVSAADFWRERLTATP